MSSARFILSKKVLQEQVDKLKSLGLKVSYSYKTNREVGNVLQEIDKDVDFSIHAREEIDMIKDKPKIWFFTQAESVEELKEIFELGVRNFVVDNEIDLDNLLEGVSQSCSNPVPARPQTPSAFANINSQDCSPMKINLSLRMKFQEHRIGTGKYFVYGMPSKKINELILKLKGNELIEKLGVHVHRKSQNTSEWEIVSELKDSLSEESLNVLGFLNLGGGLPSKYRGYALKDLDYIFEKLRNAREFLEGFDIETYIEPGRFLAAPCVKLETEIIQVQEKNLIVNATMYNCAVDTFLTGTKLLVKGELEKGNSFLIKGNSPTRDDIFRYKVFLENPKVGDKIVFLNAGAYNYTTDFFGYKKLNTEIVSE